MKDDIRIARNERLFTKIFMRCRPKSTRDQIAKSLVRIYQREAMVFVYVSFLNGTIFPPLLTFFPLLRITTPQSSI